MDDDRQGRSTAERDDAAHGRDELAANRDSRSADRDRIGETRDRGARDRDTAAATRSRELAGRLWHLREQIAERLRWAEQAVPGLAAGDQTPGTSAALDAYGAEERRLAALDLAAVQALIEILHDNHGDRRAAAIDRQAASQDRRAAAADRAAAHVDRIAAARDRDQADIERQQQSLVDPTPGRPEDDPP